MMRRIPLSAVVVTVAAVASLHAGETTHVATFEDGVNLGNWTYGWWDAGVPLDLTVTGGNPGGMLRQELCCGSFAPAAHTIGASVFTGDYRADEVTEIRVDVRVFNLEPYLFPLSLRLQTDAATPDDPADDFAAFFSGGPAQELPVPDADLVYGQWKTISFTVPSQALTLPPGWGLHPADPLFGEVPRGADWNVLIANITRVSLEFGPIVPFWPIEYWDLAIDNVTIVRAATQPVFADLNGDGVVDGMDLALLLAQWGTCPACLTPVEPPNECPADLFGDCFINGIDLALLLGAWSDPSR